MSILLQFPPDPARYSQFGGWWRFDNRDKKITLRWDTDEFLIGVTLKISNWPETGHVEKNLNFGLGPVTLNLMWGRPPRPQRTAPEPTTLPQITSLTQLGVAGAAIGENIIKKQAAEIARLKKRNKKK